MICCVDGCESLAVARGWCGKHWQRWRKNGDPLAMLRRANGEGTVLASGHVQHGGILDHVAVAERALGKKLPHGAIVHHVDEDASNNAPANLVICPSQAYHMLIHQRMRALENCGYAHWLKCTICKRYDDPSNMAIYPDGRRQKIAHRECSRLKSLEYRRRK
jgi:hypothetical protein